MRNAMRCSRWRCQPARHALANAALKYRFGEDHQPVTVSQLLTPRRREDYSDDLWTVYQRVQENLMKGDCQDEPHRGKAVAPVLLPVLMAM
jgi:hypothetical protein